MFDCPLYYRRNKCRRFKDWTEYEESGGFKEGGVEAYDRWAGANDLVLIGFLDDNPQAFTFEWRESMDRALVDKDSGQEFSPHIANMVFNGEIRARCASGSTRVPALVNTRPSTTTCAARINARARSREGARPRSATS